jgi:hypothetical protein
MLVDGAVGQSNPNGGGRIVVSPRRHGRVPRDTTRYTKGKRRAYNCNYFPTTLATGGGLIRVHREDSDWLGITLAALGGLGAGLLTGLVLNELLGDVHPERVRRAVRRVVSDDQSATARDRRASEVRAALAADPVTAELSIRVRVHEDGTVELEGSVPDGRTRELAGDLAGACAGGAAVVNRLRVRNGGGRKRAKPSQTG